MSTTVPHTDFDGAFTTGTVFVHGEDRCATETLKRGTLVTPTGRLVACDVLRPERAQPFKRKVEPGKYPVDIACIDWATCALRVRFSRRKPAVWEPALRVGERRTKDIETHPPCFGVDSGMAGIFDAKAATLAGKDENWSAGFDANAGRTVEIDARTGANVVWSFSGNGDGGYPSYWGLDRSGDVAALVLDFLVLVEPLYDELAIEDLPNRVGNAFEDPWFEQAGCTDVRLSWSKRKGELRLEYRCAEALEVELLNNRGRPNYGGSSGGGQNGLHHFTRDVDLEKEKRAKLVVRRFVGIRSLPRG